MPAYSKLFLSTGNQLKLLKSRGLQVDNDANAIDALRTSGYFRLSAYWYPFRQIVTGVDAHGNPVQNHSDVFLPNSRFEDALELYVFDKKLKFVLLDAIECVEIAVRVEIALQLGARNRFAYTNPKILHPNFSLPGKDGKIPYKKWTDKFNTRFSNSTDEFTLHHKKRYGYLSPLPIWIAIEIWDFGLLSRFFRGMQVTDKQNVAATFLIPDWQLMATWLRSLNYVRNVIAHHGRLWNLNLSDRPSLPALSVMSEFDVLFSLHKVNARIYSVCCILSHFSKTIDPKSDWSQKLVELIKEFPKMPYAGIKDMGFPADWQSHNFWN